MQNVYSQKGYEIKNNSSISILELCLVADEFYLFVNQITLTNMFQGQLLLFSIFIILPYLQFSADLAVFSEADWPGLGMSVS